MFARILNSWLRSCRLRKSVDPFFTYNESSADNFENIIAEIWSISLNINIIIKYLKTLLEKEEIVLLQQCFQRSSAADASKCVYSWKRAIHLYTVDIAHYQHLIQPRNCWCNFNHDSFKSYFDSLWFPTYNKSAEEGFEIIKFKIWNICFIKCISI